MKTKNNVRGFSLIELTLVVALVTLFLVTAAPSIRVYLENTKVSTVPDSAKKGMQKARFHASNHNHLTQFVINAAGDGWIIREQIPADDGTTPTAETIETFVWGADGSNWTSVNTVAKDADGEAANAITFNGMGLVVPNTVWKAPSADSTDPVALDGSIARIDVTSNTGMAGAGPFRVDVGIRGIRICKPSASATGHRAC